MSKNKEIIVAVSGGMDPIHVGHLMLFKEAKKLGDRLIVILNNDNWLKAKKGRVFMPEQDRKKIIEELACVDEVIISKHPKSPRDMSVSRELANIRPHIFANGGDRTSKNTPEKDLCREFNIKMAYNVGGKKVRSSSELLKRYHGEESSIV